MLNGDLLQNLIKEVKVVPKEEVFTNMEKVVDYFSPSVKKEVKHFVTYFKKRYEKIRGFLLTRADLQSATSLSKVARKSEKEPVALIGVVLTKDTTKNGHIIFSRRARKIK